MKITSVCNMSLSSLRHIQKFIPEFKTVKCRVLEEGKQYHFVYCIINKATGKFYIGKHTTSNPPLRFSKNYHGSSLHLKNAINKYGTKKFRMLILKQFKTSEAAYLYEKKIITQDMLVSKLCYNLKGGGNGFGVGELNNSYQRVKNGTHNFLTKQNGASVSSERVKKGTHHFLTRPDGSSLQQDKVEAGIHTFQRRADGTSVASDLVVKGINHFSGIKPWNSYNASAEAKNTWYQAFRIYKFYLKFPEYHARILKRILEEKYKLSLSLMSIKTMIVKFDNGWIPKSDLDWKLFRYS